MVNNVDLNKSWHSVFPAKYDPDKPVFVQDLLSDIVVPYLQW